MKPSHKLRLEKALTLSIFLTIVLNNPSSMSNKEIVLFLKNGATNVLNIASTALTNTIKDA